MVHHKVYTHKNLKLFINIYLSCTHMIKAVSNSAEWPTKKPTRKKKNLNYNVDIFVIIIIYI